jgi:hypothetical protein
VRINTIHAVVVLIITSKQYLCCWPSELSYLGIGLSNLHRSCTQVGWLPESRHWNDFTTFHFSWTTAATCAVGSRLLLNMRERYYKEHTMNSIGMSDSSQEGVEMVSTISGMTFATASHGFAVGPASSTATVEANDECDRAGYSLHDTG